MTGVDDLVTWLRDQLDARERELDEDERVAKAITAPEWNEGCSWLADLRDPLPSQRRAYGLPKEWGLLTEADTRHIARWDPDRVLRKVAIGRAEVDATRRILELHAPVNGYDPNGPVCSTCGETGNPGDETAVVRWPCPTVRLLALPYAGRPGYQEEWRPIDPA